MDDSFVRNLFPEQPELLHEEAIRPPMPHTTRSTVASVAETPPPFSRNIGFDDGLPTPRRLSSHGLLVFETPPSQAHCIGHIQQAVREHVEFRNYANNIISSIRDQLKTSQCNYSLTQLLLEASETKAKSLDARILDVEGKLVDARKDLYKLKRSSSIQISKLKKRVGDMVEQHSKEIDDYSSKLEKALKKVQTQKETISKLAADVRRLKKSSLKKDLDRANLKLEETKVHKEAAERVSRREARKCASLDKKVREAQDRIAEHKSQRDLVSERAKSLRDTGNQLRHKLELKQEEIGTLTAALASSKDLIRAERVSEALRMKVEGMKTKFEAEKANVEGMKTKFEAEKANVAALAGKLSRKRREVSQLSERVQLLNKSCTKLSNRAKYRGRELKKTRTALKIKKKEEWFKLPKRKLKQDVTPATLARRRKMHEANMTEAFRRSSAAWSVDIEDYGVIELVELEEDGVQRRSIKVKKGSTMKQRIKSFLAAHDSGMSKKKMHEARMMLGGSCVPKLQDINAYQKELNEEITSSIDISFSESAFVCDVYDILTYVIHYRGIYHPELHVMLEGDGRGTGKSLKSCIVNFRLINEGRLMHRQDRAYLLALLVGQENYDLVAESCKKLFQQLNELQQGGLMIEKPDGTSYTASVFLHSIGDAKWQAMMYGMVSFISKGSCCLFCKCERQHFAEVERRWETDEDRFDNSNVGVFGRKKKDLIPFIPQSRRWLENMHLLMRFLFDKLIVSGWHDIIWNENGNEGRGMAYIQTQMTSDDIGMPGFKFDWGRDKAGEDKLVWTSVPASKVPLIAKHFNFLDGYRLRPDRGKLLQGAIRDFESMYKELQNWPGDGPDMNAKDIFRAHRDLVLKVIGANLEYDPDDDEAPLPGEDAFNENDNAQPLTTVTPYCHMWLNHTGEQFERSRALRHYFVPHVKETGDIKETGDERLEGIGRDGGGLKFARTESLERSNLVFFHNYFQTLDRRPATVVKRAGLQIMRQMFNPEKADRAKLFCIWCGRGFVYQKPFRDHESKTCSQRPPDYTDWLNQSVYAKSISLYQDKVGDEKKR